MVKTSKTVIAIISAFMFVLLLPYQVLACDTYVALSNATADGSVLFGKTSGRNSQECMYQAYYPRQKHAAGSKVKLTHMEIPQVPVTYAIRGGQPYWGYGFEFGMNELGVCIGNEAIYTKDPVYPAPDGKALTGMDILRLGLERGKTAYEAMHIMIDLIEKYGQNGNCTNAPNEEYIYWNSYLIADPKEAWVLETSDRNWVAKKVKDVWAISNIATIRDTYDECSKDLVSHAIKQGWCTADEPFDFAKAYTSFTTWPYYGEAKLARSTSILRENRGKIDLHLLMSLTRDHHDGDLLESRFGRYQIFGTLCGHDTDYSNAGGMVAQLRKDPDLAAEVQNVYWSAMSSACTSPFSPSYFLGDSPKETMVGNGKYSADSPWWAYELLERMARRYEAFQPMIREVWRSIERDLFAATEMIEKQVTRLIKAGKTKEAEAALTAFMRKNFDQHWAIAKALAETMRDLWKVLPHKTDLIDPKETYDKAAGIVLFP